jgi:hypothetical protein
MPRCTAWIQRPAEKYYCPGQMTQDKKKPPPISSVAAFFILFKSKRAAH